MKFHGNYCGPNWSAGKVQKSVVSNMPGIDEADEMCREHDACYALEKPLQECDKTFITSMLRKPTPKRVAMASAVGAQYGLRVLDNIISSKHPTPQPKQNKTQTNLKIMSKSTRKNVSSQTPKMRVANKPPPAYMPMKSAAMSAVPTRFATRTKMLPPAISNKNGKIQVTHTTLVGPITGSTTYSSQRFFVNPGMAELFPWISRLAKSYDKYVFKKLKFIYKGVCATTTDGVVLMSFDFDTLDELPANKYVQAQTYPNAETNVFSTTELEVKCDQVSRFIRQGVVSTSSSGADQKMYDLGQLVISSSFSAAVTIGELYVEYTVELDKPSYGFPLTTRLHATGAAGTILATSSTYGSSKPWSKTNPSTGVVSATNIYCCVPGEYFFNFYSNGVGITGHTATMVSTSGGLCTGINAIIINAAATYGASTWKVRAQLGDYITVDCAVVTSHAASLLYFVEGEYGALS